MKQKLKVEYQGFLMLVDNMTRGKIKGVLRKLGMN